MKRHILQIFVFLFITSVGGLTYAELSGEDVFKSYTSFALGGVWRTTIEDEVLEHSYQKFGQGKYVQVTGERSSPPFAGILGVNPETKKCTMWLFLDDGGFGRNVLTQLSENIWLLEGAGVGPAGKSRLKYTITRVDQNTLKQDVEFAVDGGDLVKRTNVWTRVTSSRR